MRLLVFSYTAVRDTATESESTFQIVVGIAFYVAFYFILMGASNSRDENFNYELKGTDCGFSPSWKERRLLFTIFGIAPKTTVQTCALP